MPEGRRIFPRMTVLENLQMGATFADPGNYDADLKRMFVMFPIASRADAMHLQKISGNATLATAMPADAASGAPVTHSTPASPLDGATLSCRQLGLGLGLAAGFCLALHSGTWISSLEYTSVASSTALVTTNPLWIALASFVLFGERPGSATLAGIVLSLGDLRRGGHARRADRQRADGLRVFWRNAGTGSGDGLRSVAGRDLSGGAGRAQVALLAPRS